jgi:hypothetical protein
VYTGIIRSSNSKHFRWFKETIMNVYGVWTLTFSAQFRIFCASAGRGNNIRKLRIDIKDAITWKIFRCFEQFFRSRPNQFESSCTDSLPLSLFIGENPRVPRENRHDFDRDFFMGVIALCIKGRFYVRYQTSALYTKEIRSSLSPRLPAVPLFGSWTI